MVFAHVVYCVVELKWVSFRTKSVIHPSQSAGKRCNNWFCFDLLKTLLKRKRNYLTMLNLNSSITFLLRSSFSSELRTLSPQTLMATSRLSVVFRGKVLPEFRSSRQIKIKIPSRMKYKFKGLWLLQMRIFVNRLIIYFYSLNTNVTFRSKLCRQVKKKLAIKVVDCCMQGMTILS